ncbi:MAG: metal ABC transporter permease [Anaerolineae bacterium]|nr:metal ABC transporter permease [Anaerolineae bacterium]
MDGLVEVIVGPLAYPFMVRGLLALVMVGGVCAVVGTYVVLRGMAFFGSALAHAILPGVAVGYLVSGSTRGPIFWWGLATAILTAVGIGAVGKSAKVKEDTAIGILFAGMFALGIAIISTVEGYAGDLAHFLFGNVLGVSAGDLWLAAIFGGLVLLTIVALFKEFLVFSFDPLLAETLRLPTGFLHYLMLILIAVTTVVSLQAVGVALMVALLVTPAATAYLLTRRLPAMMAISALVGAVSGVLGFYISYYVEVASGAAVVLVCTAIFLLTLLFAPRRGLVWERLRR